MSDSSEIIKRCSCGHTEFRYDYKVKVNPTSAKFGKVAGFKEVTYSCIKCGNRYFVREEL